MTKMSQIARQRDSRLKTQKKSGLKFKSKGFCSQNPDLKLRIN